MDNDENDYKNDDEDGDGDDNTRAITLSKATNFRLFQTERVCRRQFPIR